MLSPYKTSIVENPTFEVLVNHYPSNIHHNRHSSFKN